MSTSRQPGQRPEVSPDECSTLGAAPALHSLLEREGLVDPVEFSSPDEAHGPAHACVRRTVGTVVVLPDTCLEVDGGADVVRAVRTFDDVGPCHGPRIAPYAAVRPQSRDGLWRTGGV